MPLPSFPSRFRRAAALALTASAMFGTQVAAFAQDEPPDDGDDAVEIVGWDLSDPVNRAESREFFAGLWAAEDAGLPPPAFEFTNTPPGLILAMLLPELEVFTEIYRHRLQLDFDAGERYLVTDLIADDAEVRAEFRAFVLTGKLAPRPELDADAYLAHLELVIDAMTVQQRASIERVEALGVLVESEGMSVEEAPSADEGPTLSVPSSSELKRTKCALLWLLSASRLGCIYDKLRVPPSNTVDFDCDDAADALLRRLLLLQGPDGARLLPPGWRAGGTAIVACKDPNPPVGRGHAVPVLIDPSGRYWYIEPSRFCLTDRRRPEIRIGARRGRRGNEAVSAAIQRVEPDAAIRDAVRIEARRIRQTEPRAERSPTDAVCGPYHTEEDLLRALRKRYLRDCDSPHPGIVDSLLPMHDLSLHAHEVLNEGAPWWTSPVWREKFCVALAECCEATPRNFLDCTQAEWIPTPRPTFQACDIREYMPNPLPTWQESWGSLTPCTPPAR